MNFLDIGLKKLFLFQIWLGYIGDEILPIYIGIICLYIQYRENPYPFDSTTNFSHPKTVHGNR